jgi:parvulin-like peptidyl-prolyl isomerase
LLRGQAPTDAQLQAYLQAHAERFEVGPRLAFQQIYLSPERRGDKIEQDAATLVETLRKSPSETPPGIGDATLLPSEVSLTGLKATGEMFGDDFAEALDKAETNLWTGPLRSAFGLHLVRILDRKPGRLPALDEVRAAVARDWANETRKSVEDARYRQLLARYHVAVETQPGAGR